MENKPPTQEELADAWEHVLTQAPKLSSGMKELLRTTVSALRGDKTSELQKAINTWSHILLERYLPPKTTRQVNMTLFYLTRIEQ